MSDADGSGGAFDAAAHWRRVEVERRRREERLARWVVPGSSQDPAAARLPDGRPVWRVVAELWARDLDLQGAAAEGLADAEALEAVLEFFRRRGAGLIGVLSRSVPAAALPTPPALPDVDALPPALRAALAACRVDLVIEKHEGPWNWYWPHRGEPPADRPQFLAVTGRAVLLPVARGRHAALAVLRAVAGADGRALLLELRDEGAAEAYGEAFAGRLAVCDRWPHHTFFVCHTYHQWYPVGPGAGAWGAAEDEAS